MAIEIYKRGQGRYTRTSTFLSGVLIGLLVARYVMDRLNAAAWASTTWGRYVAYGVPLLMVGGTFALMYWIINRPKSADFMIATEGEMKKVSWSSRKEIIGGTKVVIATTLILAVLLWAVDLAFSFFFRSIGVLQIGD